MEAAPCGALGMGKRDCGVPELQRLALVGNQGKRTKNLPGASLIIPCQSRRPSITSVADTRRYRTGLRAVVMPRVARECFAHLAPNVQALTEKRTDI
jgi:hypothetical protein